MSRFRESPALSHVPSPAEPALVWLRNDLRLADNPAVVEAARGGRPLVLLYVLDEVSPGIRPLGSAARWWLHRSLLSLSRDVEASGARLILRRGPAELVVPGVVDEVGAACVHWNRRWGGAEIAIDGALKTELRAMGREVVSHRGTLLHEPTTFVGKSGGPFRVFTPFWKALTTTFPPRPPLPRQDRLVPFEGDVAGDALADWRLTPSAPDWSSGLAAMWTPGEAGAAKRLSAFLDEGIYSYSQIRDRPDLDLCSHLSPHLRFGEISPYQVFSAVEAATRGSEAPPRVDADKFLAEVGWREFAHHLLAQFPDLASRNFQARFDRFPWGDDEPLLRAWQRGRTGYPLVDAGMRELWATGTMHNRVRMVVASFLVKHLLIDWRAGETWFWDTLVDACPADNPANWQWVAGCGADAAPYFRIFNPVTQGEKFDPAGDYVRRFVPELARLPADVIHAPWTAPRSVLEAADVELGRTYPHPIVDHARARERALAAFAATRS